MYLRAIAPVWVFAGRKSARRIDAWVFSGRVLASLSLGLPAQRGPVMRAAWCIATSTRERRSAFVAIEADCFFSPLSEPSVIGGVFPQVGTLIYGTIGTRAPIRDIWSQIRALAIVTGTPPTIRDRVEATTAGRRRSCRIERSARLRHVRRRWMISEIVIIVGSHAGTAQVMVAKRWTRLKLS